MISPKAHKGFTILETVIASAIFLIVIVASFSLYRYTIRIGAESRSVSDIANIEQSAFDVIDSIITVEGWENFNDRYVNTGKNYLLDISNPATGKYSLVEQTSINGNSNFSIPYTDAARKFQWRFVFTTDDDNLGPYIKNLSFNGGIYTFIFSRSVSVLQSNLPMDSIMPIINNSSHNWQGAGFGSISNTNSVQVTKNTSNVAAGDKVKPSTNMVYYKDGVPYSDITYRAGVSLPASGASTTGYPQIIKVCVTALVQQTEIEDTKCQYVRYEE